MNNPLMLILISPFYLIPIGMAFVVAWALWAFLAVIFDRIRGPKVIYTPKTDSPEFIDAMEAGYSPRLGLQLSEIFSDPIQRPDIDRILAVREKLFSHEFNGFFYSGFLQDLTPMAFKALGLRLFLEMSFMRSYLREKSSRLWTERAEEIWICHTPKPLRKLNPDYYRQLLTRMNEDRTTNRSPIVLPQ